MRRARSLTAEMGRQTRWLVFAAGISAAALVAVHAMQGLGGYLPCELCLRQREVYWIALAVALGALAVGRLRSAAVPVGVVALGVAFAIGTLVAGYHAGVEWRWWPGPSSCTGHAPGHVRAADVAAALSGATRLHMVRCDEAALRIVGLSLSGWNALLSLGLSVASVVAARPRRRL